MAKRRVGYAQAALTLLGFAVFIGFMLWYFAGLLRAAGDFTADLEQFQTMVRSRAWIAGLGIGVVFVAWLWAVFSSMRILRAAREMRMPSP
jgi:hypothetical protein